MASRKESYVDSAIRNLDLTLSLEIPIPAQSDSCSYCPSISLGPVKIPLGTSEQQQPISAVFTKDSLIGNSLSLDTTGDQET